MKKKLFAAVIILAVAASMAGVVSANGGPHGGYTATTDACAGCHRAHTAIGPRLLLASSTYNLCMTCHGSAGPGANTNVEDGFYLSSRDDTTGDGNHGAANTTDDNPLLGGGFTNHGAGNAVNSSHDPTGAELGAWGYNVITRGITATLGAGNELDCASCHDPHGNGNYRIIAETVMADAIVVAQVDEAAKDYDDEQWSGVGLSALCAACHDAYHQTAADQGETLNAGSYTHRIDMAFNVNENAGATNPDTVGMWDTVNLVTQTVPLADNTTVVCTTCHLPHGTAATMAGLALGTYDPAGAVGPIPSADSALLRIDNRGVCEVCHQK